MQGGGSLGAYECGVYKILAKHGIKFDVVAGTSIGAINAAIIAGTKNNDPAKALEDFWLTLSERVTPSLLPDNMRSVVSSMYAAVWGNPNAFAPKWFTPSPDYFEHLTWPYLYGITPLMIATGSIVNAITEFTNSNLASMISISKFLNISYLLKMKSMYLCAYHHLQ